MVDLRIATAADARGIAIVLVRSWRVTYRGLLPDDALSGLSISEREQFWTDTLTTPALRTSTVVATITGVVVGFAATGPPLVPHGHPDPTLGDLYALYLDPDVWRRGIGGRLHDVALDRLRINDFTHAGLWVLDRNEPAIAFYLHHGWTDTGRRHIEDGPGGVQLHVRRLHRPVQIDLSEFGGQAASDGR